MELIENIITSIPKILFGGLGTVVVFFAIEIIIAVLIIRAICKYMAKKNAEAFDYDRLATRTAEEICKRMMIIENNRKEKQTQEDKEE